MKKLKKIILLLFFFGVAFYLIFMYLNDAKYSGKSVALIMYLPYKLKTFSHIDEVSKTKIIDGNNRDDFIDYKLIIDEKIVILRNDSENITLVIVPEEEKIGNEYIKSYKCYGFPASKMQIARCENFIENND